MGFSVEAKPSAGLAGERPLSLRDARGRNEGAAGAPAAAGGSHRVAPVSVWRQYVRPVVLDTHSRQPASAGGAAAATAALRRAARDAASGAAT